MPLTAQSLYILANDCFLALLAFRGLSFCTLRLAIQTPSIPILLDMGHTFLERIAAFRTEEVSIVPVLTQCNHVFSNDGSLAMFTTWSKVLMPVKMTIKPQSLITIFCHGLAFDLWELFSLCTTSDSVDALGTLLRGLRTNFERF
jgi:hypothetical protein